jgi:hypothetical protein
MEESNFQAFLKKYLGKILLFYVKFTNPSYTAFAGFKGHK